MKKQTVAETISQNCRTRPVLKPFLETFEPLLTKRRELAERLLPEGAGVGNTASAYPLLRGNIPPGAGRLVREAAADLLPILGKMEAVLPHRGSLEALFLAGGDEDLETLITAFLSDDREAVIALAARRNLDPQILVFASDFIVSAVLRAYAAQLVVDDFPEWRKGVCPVCGSPPVMAWLDRRPPNENSEFLASGGGKKRLHCGLCGADWHFVRGICPSCGAQGQDAMQILGEEDRRFERIDWCKQCNTYLPLIDLREMADTPDMDAMALCLMHLDLAAAERGLSPLKLSFWNMF